MVGTSKRACTNPPRGGRGMPRTPPSPSPPLEVPPVPGFEQVVLHDDAKWDRFVRLQGYPFLPMRFIDCALMTKRGIGEDMLDLFKGTSLPYLYGMAEFTYRDLTLEFLSSFTYDSTKRLVDFRLRLRNRNHPMPLATFASHFGFRTESTPIPSNFTISNMWFSMTTTTEYEKGGLRLSEIHDPRL